MPAEDPGDLQTPAERLVEQHPRLELGHEREPRQERDRGEEQEAHDDLIATCKRPDRAPQPHLYDRRLDSLRDLLVQICIRSDHSSSSSERGRCYWESRVGCIRRAYQEHAPSGRHEGEDAHEYVLDRHVGDRYQDYHDGYECDEYQPLDQPEHQLELRAEFPPPQRHTL